MAPQILGGQSDFSFGEVDPDLKRRDDHPARKGGLRQMANMRIHNSGIIQNRPGRSALFLAPNKSRIEELTMSAGNTFKIAFGFAGGTGTIDILNSAGAVVATFTARGSGAALPWTLATVNRIVYVPIGLQIFITFPGMRPQVITWNGAAAWNIADYTELLYGGQKRTPFYRLSPQGISLKPSATTGVVTLIASAPLFTSAHIGTRMRWVGRQVLITAVPAIQPSPSATATVQEVLNTSISLAAFTDPRTQLSIGDVIIGKTSGAKAIVTTLSAANILGVLLTGVTFASGTDPNEDVIGPAGIVHIVAASTAVIAPESTTDWDDEVMNDFRGYPASCFADQFRFGLCNYPAIPGAIGWSSINLPTDMYVGANPSDAMLEIAPSKVRVLYVVPGPESSEFVFCDRRVYYIPISPTNPLKPGSVGFQILSGDGSAPVQPRLAQEAILYVNAGQNSMMAVIATGAYYRPFATKNLSDLHAHLFNNIQAIAAPNADGTFNERYAYVLNGDGTISVGKYNSDSLQTATPVIGWGPWSGGATVSWIAAWDADVLFTSSYFGTTLCEVLDDSRYLDCSLVVNALPPAFTPPAGLGPLWFIPSQSVSLMDQVTRSMGTYQIDANGFIVPQGVGGENLAIASLVAGQPWTAITEPFCPTAPPGSDQGQRMKERQIAIFAAWITHSTGFTMAGLFSSKQTRTSPPLGTVMNQRRVTAYNQDDDATLPPPQRETVEFHKPPGTTYDPRVAIIQDTPGPLQILELVIECSL